MAVESLFYLACAAFGISALLFAIPIAHDALRIAGAIYLAYLAWQAVRPGGRSPFEARALDQDSPRRLIFMGLFTNLLNLKQALFYMALLPQFIDEQQGQVLKQFLTLGFIQIFSAIKSLPMSRLHRSVFDQQAKVAGSTAMAHGNSLGKHVCTHGASG